ncbi:SanA/YdcF family protein [Zobellia laminariae]|uniref:SanA/YdcF family protein n=1 Tax=Zobellia laminariae TaxID=248906 RepID=UPI0012D94E5D|nr:ElyC/SanA/YdcF family protein [Zobellia laminariae]MUH38932.1 vancomycin high temperature exclusion protein [Zobellia laminariae]WKX78523.1 ElyC/SanA/YdcF family protein [Zobellia laminariae]
MRKRYYKIGGVLVLALFLFILLCDFIISSSAKGKTFSDPNEIPKNRVGLVLGTSKKLIGGLPNPYYTYRINATIELYKSKKIDFVLVSGDNGTRYYNEPNTFKKDLIAKGIPSEKIFLDFAGFRTLDSMVRAKEVFGLNNVTVISQEFHNQRAIYLAEKKGLNAIGYNAKSIIGTQGLKVHLREYLARVKVFIDLVLNIQPKFFGERVEIK